MDFSDSSCAQSSYGLVYPHHTIILHHLLGLALPQGIGRRAFSAQPSSLIIEDREEHRLLR